MWSKICMWEFVRHLEEADADPTTGGENVILDDDSNFIKVVVVASKEFNSNQV
jgi:hypothetical protein